VFDDILIAVDGRDGGHDAIALAEQLAGERARLALAHVYGAGLMPGRGAALLLASEREETRKLLEHERDAASLDAQLLPYAERSVGRGLRQLAASRGNDLLVVGRGHHGLFGRAFHSDDTSVALNGTPCPVAIAPQGFAQRSEPLLRIGIGYDNSPEAHEAITVALELAARRQGASVRAVAALGDEARATTSASGASGGQLAEAAADLEAREISFDAVHGLPTDVLEHFSRELDLLIVGSRSHGPLCGLFNGSTSTHLARNAGCALLVLPRGAVARPARRHRERAA
jgi:nucleotide-binding universal stress UspA family protein